MSKLSLIMLLLGLGVFISSSTINDTMQQIRLLDLPNLDYNIRHWQERGVNVNNQLLRELKFILPPNPIGVVNNISAYSHYDANLFCCDCARSTLNCPICFFNNDHMCEYPYKKFSTKSKSWFNHRFSVEYKLHQQLLPYEAVILPSDKTYFPSRNSPPTRFSILDYSASCIPEEIGIEVVPGLEAEHCGFVVDSGEECTRPTDMGYSDCDWTQHSRIKINDRYDYCYTAVNDGFTISFAVGDVKNFCTSSELLVDLPAMNSIATELTLGVDPLKMIGHDSSSVYFSTTNYSDYKLLATLLQYSRAHGVSTYKTKLRAQCEATIVEVGFDGKPSWLGNILFLPPCSLYLPYNSTHDICYDFLTRPYPYCSSTLFKKSLDRTYTFSKPLGSIIFTNTFNTTCHVLEEATNCSFFKLINVTNDNLLAGLNRIMNSSIDRFFDILGHNSTVPNKYYTSGPYVGNWISSLFGVLIEPFFDAFINIVVKGFLPPLTEALIAFVDVVADGLSKLADSLLKSLEELAVALTKLLTTIINILTSMLLFLEAHFLLFEYLVLFLFIQYRILNNPWFAFFIVVIVSLLIGVERKSPSFLLHFVNPKFLLIDFTFYYNKSFNYDYNIYYHYNSTHSVGLFKLS